MSPEEITGWLHENDPQRLEELWREADAVRRRGVGDVVHLRGLIEFSNVCQRQCTYCGLRAGHSGLVRYRMTAAEILACARAAVRFGYGTVVLQSGEDWDMSAAWLADVVRQIKHETGLAVTLSVGERSVAELACWRESGADRYLLRFETSNPVLFRRIHPPRKGEPAVDRMALLGELRKFGYEVGSGVMVGIPGQSYADLAGDIRQFVELDLDMIGVGPFLPNPHTPAGREAARQASDMAADQVPNNELMTYKSLALTRINCPLVNIPSTTALATLNRDTGRELGLCRGANVVMPNLTPVEYRSLYEIYPGKACINETAEACQSCMRRRIESLGRSLGRGPGQSENWKKRHAGGGGRAKG